MWRIFIKIATLVPCRQQGPRLQCSQPPNMTRSCYSLTTRTIHLWTANMKIFKIQPSRLRKTQMWTTLTLQVPTTIQTIWLKMFKATTEKTFRLPVLIKTQWIRMTWATCHYGIAPWLPSTLTPFLLEDRSSMESNRDLNLFYYTLGTYDWLTSPFSRFCSTCHPSFQDF